MKSSIVVPTYNGRQRIIRFLESVAGQTRMPDEVIVVVDGSKDDTVDAINAVPHFKKLPLLVHVQENKGRPAARNAGIRLSKNELILSFDDDMVLTPTVVEQHLNHHAKHPETVAVGYQAERKPDENDPHYIFLDFRYYLSNKWNRESPHYPEPMSITNYQLTTANCSFPKSIINVVGFFDEQLKEVEDFDLGTRIMQKGYKMYYYPDIVAWHDNPDWDFKKFITRQIQYRSDDLEWLKKVEKQGNLKTEFLLHPRFTVDKQYSPVKKTILQFLAKPFWVKLAENKPFTSLPRSFRYKFMDVVTAAFTYTQRKPGN